MCRLGKRNVLFFSGLALSVTYGDTSPKGRGLGIMIYFAWTAKAPTLGELSSECETERARMLPGKRRSFQTVPPLHCNLFPGMIQ